MKRIVMFISVLALPFVALAQPSPKWLFQPLLSGYNVLALTNGATWFNALTSTVGYGSTNVMYTTPQGSIVYSLTNNYIGASGIMTTNLNAPDAFKVVTLAAGDVNGDINANASVYCYVNNTNWFPIAVTNSAGQYFPTNWLLAPTQYPNWMTSVTTNTYPTFNAGATNALTVSLYRSSALTPNGSSTGPKVALWETTSTFTFTVIGNGVTPVLVVTNLPVGWLQGAKHVYATVSAAANVGGPGIGTVINELGILQVVP